MAHETIPAIERTKSWTKTLYSFFFLISLVDSFGVDLPSTTARHWTTTTSSSLSSSSMEQPAVLSTMDISEEYTEDQLKNAMQRLYGSDPQDCRHIFGYKDENHQLSMLQRITATVYLDYERYQQGSVNTLQELLDQAQAFAKTHGPIQNLQTSIQQLAPRMALAAEFKRASPSKGDIALHVQAGEQAKKYANAGANILSCLTEGRWFKGSLQDLRDMRLATNNNGQQQRPIVLRKDFVINEYMIAEAAAAGADTVLLIVAVLPQSLLETLIEYCRSLSMEPLVEVHAPEELQVALAAGARVIGVNNRNLHTFQVDMAQSEMVANMLDDQKYEYRHGHKDATISLCALSGMSTKYDVHRYRQAGIGMCLIGESLMRASDPSGAIQSLCLDPVDYETSSSKGGGGGGAYTAGTQLVKVCGITNADDALVACRAGANMIGVIFAEKSKRKVTPEQATQVVQAVRTFGERSSRATFDAMPSSSNSESNAISSLIAHANALVQGAKQRPVVVGVFQNHDPDFVRQMVEECGLDMVQLHGSEGMAAANRKNFGVPVIRIVDIAVDPESGHAAENAVDTILQTITNDPAAILLDTSIKGAKDGGGGTGVAFDWSIAERVQAAGLPVIVAGGLTVESVSDCVQRIRPFGVDVASGVEQGPGVKDHDKVRGFVQGAKSAAVEASKGF